MGEREVIDEMVRRMVLRSSPAKVLLYGSHARQEAGPQSDVDILVLFDTIDDRRRLVSDLYETLAGMPFPKDIVVATLAEFERYRTVVNTLHWAVAREGRALYERLP